MLALLETEDNLFREDGYLVSVNDQKNTEFVVRAISMEEAVEEAKFKLRHIKKTVRVTVMGGDWERLTIVLESRI